MDLAVVGGSLSLFSYSAVAAAVAEMAVVVAETAAVVVAATMVAAAADADLTALFFIYLLFPNAFQGVSQ